MFEVVFEKPAINLRPRMLVLVFRGIPVEGVQPPPSGVRMLAHREQEPESQSQKGEFVEVIERYRKGGEVVKNPMRHMGREFSPNVAEIRVMTMGINEHGELPAGF